MRIRQKSIVLLLFCAMIPLVAISAISFESAQSALKSQASDELQANTGATIDRIESFFEKVALDVATWSTLPVIQDVLIDDEDGDITDALVRLRAQYGYFTGFLVLNDNGQSIAATDRRNIGRDLSGTKMAKATLNGRRYQGRVGTSDLTDHEVLVFALPVRADYDADTIIGTLVALVDWAEVKSMLSEILILGHEQDNEHVLVLRRSDGTRIIYQSSGFDTGQLDKLEDGFLARTAQSSGKGGFSDPAWVMHAAVGKKYVFAGISALRHNSFVTGGVVFVVVLSIGLWGSGHISKPIVSITKAMEALASGKTSVPITNVNRTDEIGEMGRSMLVFKDNAIKRKEAEEELRRAKEEAERANLAKSKFLAAASHDLRQPLHAQGLFVASLSELNRHNESGAILEKMEQSVHALDDMLGALLEITSLETGVLQPEMDDFRVDALLRRMAIDLSPAAAEKGIEFRVMPSTAIVHSDQVLLSRIVRNLVSNAVRYTETGKVLLGCRRLPDALRIEVWDTGIGIPKRLFQSIFEEFFRAQDLDSAGNKRLGLGLTIVERTAGLLDHRIEYKSTEGKGSMFSVQVPYGISAGTDQPILSSIRPLSRNFAGIVILVIEDDAHVLSAMRGMLEKWGCKVITSHSGEEALASLNALDAMPDLAVVDYRLAQGENGFAAMESIEAAYGSGMPTVVITGTTTTSVVLQARRNGFQILHKPVQPARLRAVMSHLLETAKSG